MSIWGTLSNASPFYLTVGARYGWSGGGAEGGGVSEMTQNTAGNNGRPNPMSIWGTLSSASPFYLTVGASTIGRKYTAEFTLGDGTTFTGYSLGGTTATASPLPLMLAGSAASPPEATGAASTCDPEYVDATKVAGKFLVCIVTEWVHREWSYDAVLMWADTLGAAAILVISEAAEYDAVPIFSYSKTPSIVLKFSHGQTVKKYIEAESRQEALTSLSLSPVLSLRACLKCLSQISSTFQTPAFFIGPSHNPHPKPTRPTFPFPLFSTAPPLFSPLFPLLFHHRIPIFIPSIHSPIHNHFSFPSAFPLFPSISLSPPLSPIPRPLPPSPLPPSSFPFQFPTSPFPPLPFMSKQPPRQHSPLPRPTATLSAFTVSHSSNAPQLAYFSSTGPPRSPLYPPALLMRDFPTNDILKPDVIGPGYQLWAAAPGKSLETAATDPPEFNYYSGTSMSTPHLAGIMALIVQNKPSWSPSQVISAITTTAYTRNENGQLIQRANGKKANAWDYGGGHVDPTRVLDPGLTFHAAHKHFVNFLMMRDPIRTKKRFWRMGKAHPIFPWNLNRASIAVTRLHGVTLVYRRVKNVYNLQSTYKAKVDPPPGFNCASW
ncbi:unnamed protein product [Closterium sp. NIES-65]|nr:unnamed protein product [Closterium sp. NIES-65]